MCKRVASRASLARSRALFNVVSAAWAEELRLGNPSRPRIAKISIEKKACGNFENAFDRNRFMAIVFTAFTPCPRCHQRLPTRAGSVFAA